MSDNVSTVTVTVSEGRSIRADRRVFVSGQQCEILANEYPRLLDLGFVEPLPPPAPPEAAAPVDPAEPAEGAAPAEGAEPAEAAETNDGAEPAEPTVPAEAGDAEHAEPGDLR